MSKPQLQPPSGMRDFLPRQARRRAYIFQTIRGVFERYGYAPIETPAMERLEALTGKYGDEGEQLLYRVLNSGDFIASAGEYWSAHAADAAKLSPHIANKALRYDLTVPFARFVAQHRNELTFPFKRFQMQPVWRADRPQKGRYREFWQCDADVVGSDSLLFEAEFVLIFYDALTALGLEGFSIKINHRQILNALTEKARCADKFTDVCVAIDKLDKIGPDGVNDELRAKGVQDDSIAVINAFLTREGTLAEKIAWMKAEFAGIASGEKGVADLEELLQYLAEFGGAPGELELDLTLARGLNYYTGTIFEVAPGEGGAGSICGGGRYDDLTGIFGLKDVTGVGISFGADRIYDLMDARGLFPDEAQGGAEVFFVIFNENCRPRTLALAYELRKAGRAVEIAPKTTKKLGKQFQLADKMGIPFVAILGDGELTAGTIKLKDLRTGEEAEVAQSDLARELDVRLSQ